MNRHLTRTPLITAFAVTALAWAIYFFTSGDAVMGTDVAHRIMQMTAIAVSGVLAVLLAGTAILDIIPGIAGAPATGLQRVIVYVLLTFGISFIALRVMGFDLGAVLTTSALFTAIVGFALQPTLSGMIAGLALHGDRALHVGDAVLLDSEPVEIKSLNWRAAIGERPDGRLVVIPNSTLAGTNVEVFRAGKSHRAEFHFLGPIDYPPQRICDLVREAVCDLPFVDEEKPVAVAPYEVETTRGNIRFRAQYWLRNFADRQLAEGEGVRRVWYLYQRLGIALAPLKEIDTTLVARENFAPAVSAWLAAHPASAANTQAIAHSARLLFYAPDERIVLPQWSEGWAFVLFKGEARLVPEFDRVPDAAHDSEALHVQQLGPSARVAHLAEELAAYIGPYARMAVSHAGDTAQNFPQLCRTVALEISDHAAREEFLAKVLPAEPRLIGAGADIAVRRNAIGNLTAYPNMRACGEVVLIALNPKAEAPAVAEEKSSEHSGT